MIVRYELSYRLLEYSDFMFMQSEKSPCEREKSPKEVQRIIDIGYRNLHRMIKELGMAKKKSKPKFVWNGYVNVSIPESMTEKLKKYIADSKQIHMDANQAQIDLYTFKIYFDEDNKNYRASLTCYDPDSDNWGKMIGAFAGDWYTALAVVLYKHFHISGEEWGDVQSFSDAAFG